MITDLIVDGLVVRRGQVVFFHYLWDDHRPCIKEYVCSVDDILETVDGRSFLDVTVREVDSKKVASFGRIFSVNRIVRGTFQVKGR